MPSELIRAFLGAGNLIAVLLRGQDKSSPCSLFPSWQTVSSKQSDNDQAVEWLLP